MSLISATILPTGAVTSGAMSVELSEQDISNGIRTKTANDGFRRNFFMLESWTKIYQGISRLNPLINVLVISDRKRTLRDGMRTALNERSSAKAERSFDSLKCFVMLRNRQ